MTEQEWLASVAAEPMLEHLRLRASDRKNRLAGCAALRLMTGDSYGRTFAAPVARALDVAERFADRLATARHLGAARRVLAAWDGTPGGHFRQAAAYVIDKLP